MCWRTSSVCSGWRVNLTTAGSSPLPFSSHSRSMLKAWGRASPSASASQAAMAACGEVAVCSRPTPKPLPATRTRLVMTSSALPCAPTSITSQRWVGSIHTVTWLRRGKACGSRAISASSFRSRSSFLPGLRPVVFSISSTAFCVLSLMASAGTALVSIAKRAIHCPSTVSTSAPCSCPRGGTQPVDFCCVALHSTKGSFAIASSHCAAEAGHSGLRRYSIKFLNTSCFPMKSGPRGAGLVRIISV